MIDARKEKLKQLDDEEKSVKRIVFASLGIIGLFFLGVYVYGRLIGDDYSKVDSKTKLAGYISDVHFGRGAIFITLQNQEKFIIVTNSPTENLNYQPPELASFITASDWVEKSVSSDTLKLTKAS
jgi:hypothetical protein